jgi:hypothetical protein
VYEFSHNNLEMEQDKPSGKKLNPEAQVGIAVGVVIVMVAAVFTLFAIIRTKRVNRQKRQMVHRQQVLLQHMGQSESELSSSKF